MILSTCVSAVRSFIAGRASLSALAVISVGIGAGLIGTPSELIGDDAIFEGDGKPELLAEEGAGEGPAWHPTLGLLTSGGGHIWRRDLEGQQSIFLKNAGSNGLMFDPEGRLIVCQPGQRRIVRREANGDLTVLADKFQGMRFNATNDVTMDSQGRIYFSDPKYGERESMELRDSDGKLVEGVFRIDTNGKVSRIITHEVDRPNGLVVTHDDKHLFVADNNNNEIGGARKLWRFDLKGDGSIDSSSRKLIYDWKTTRGPDGMKLDIKGRLFVAAGLNKPNLPTETADPATAGVYVFSPEGNLLTFVPIPRDETTNCGFGDADLRSLYITAGGSLWRLRVKDPGRPVWPRLQSR